MDRNLMRSIQQKNRFKAINSSSDDSDDEIISKLIETSNVGDHKEEIDDNLTKHFTRILTLHDDEAKAEHIIDEYSDGSIILEKDPETNNILVEVDKGLAKILKPHQIDGVRFMFNSTIKSINSLVNQNYKSGCILAHSMGLGKTLQVVTFLHTLMTNNIIKKIIRKILIVVPYNVAENWFDEFNKWFKKCHEKYHRIQLLRMFDSKSKERDEMLKDWQLFGGIMIITHRMISIMIIEKRYNSLTNSDLVVVDEGHLLKNNKTTFYQSITKIKTNRRILLTGTPLQNNLSEYFYMVDFIKPKLLGTKEQFNIAFEHPIKKGQANDSDKFEVKLMKKRIHVLTKMLKNYVHRCDFNVLVPYLPPKFEFVISVRLTSSQSKFYHDYIKNLKTKNLLNDALDLKLLGNHPIILLDRLKNKSDSNYYFWLGTIYEKNLYQFESSSKFILIFSILDECKKIGDKILIFSESLLTLNLIEKFLGQRNWIKGIDYFRIDGSVNINNRHRIIDQFNDVEDSRARLMLISTKAGSLGINLVGANRCILVDCSWNPAIDSQAIFRVFRLGQKKSVYIYRLISYGTIEWKIYERQVQKQTLSRGVVDEQQIIRHFSRSELAELYTFTESPEVIPCKEIPKDNLLADLLLMHDREIITYHEHNSLFEPTPEEELNNDEKNEAWIEYIKGKTQIVALPKLNK